MKFKPYDRGEDVEIYRRNLPHWQQEGTTYFVTFRLGDSLPSEKMQVWQEQRRLWLLERGIAREADLAQAEERLRIDFLRTFNSRWHDLLDAGHGACLLRISECRAFVVSALRHWHRKRMDLDECVVMPNHVHALITPFPEQPLESLLHSIKRFSARQCNRVMNRKGALWQDENYDHITRSDAQLEHFRQYIRENPNKQRLREEEYWLGNGDSAC
jgi:REP element-mobilizing transposase RayT